MTPPQELVDYFITNADKITSVEEVFSMMRAQGWTDEKILSAYEAAFPSSPVPSAATHESAGFTPERMSQEVKIESGSANSLLQVLLTKKFAALMLAAVVILAVAFSFAYILFTSSSSAPLIEFASIDHDQPVAEGLVAEEAGECTSFPNKLSSCTPYSCQYVNPINQKPVTLTIEGKKIDSDGKEYCKTNELEEGDQNPNFSCRYYDPAVIETVAQYFHEHGSFYGAASLYMEIDPAVSDLISNAQVKGLEIRSQLVDSGTCVQGLWQNGDAAEFASEINAKESEILATLGMEDYPELKEMYDQFFAVECTAGLNMEVTECQALFACMKDNILSVEKYASTAEIRALRAIMAITIFEKKGGTDMFNLLATSYPTWGEQFQTRLKECGF